MSSTLSHSLAAVITGVFFTVNPKLITEFLITRDLVPTIRVRTFLDDWA